jgi:hypothetical protein
MTKTYLNHKLIDFLSREKSGFKTDVTASCDTPQRRNAWKEIANSNIEDYEGMLDS